MSDTEDIFLNSSRPLLRAFSIQSYEGEENGATSQNLLEDLAERGARVANPAHDEDQVTISLMRGVKRTMDSLVTEVKKLKDQVLFHLNLVYILNFRVYRILYSIKR